MTNWLTTSDLLINRDRTYIYLHLQLTFTYMTPLWGKELMHSEFKLNKIYICTNNLVLVTGHAAH